MRSFDADIIVVGSGPGGSVTAALLAEAGRNVLLLEEGQDFSTADVEPFSVEELSLKYRYGGIGVTQGTTRIAFAEARCLGGGSEINSGLYHRTPPEVLEQWRVSHQLEKALPEDLAPHFVACERDLSVSLAPGAMHPISQRLHEGATALRWKSLEVPRWVKYEQAGSGVGGEVNGVRQTMTRTYLKTFGRDGGRIQTQTRLTRLRRENRGWELEVTCGSGDGRRSERLLCRTLVMACGATQTPSVLRRSGIRRNIGATLRMHPTLKVVAEFHEPVNDANAGVQMHQVKEFAPSFSFGCSISTRPFLKAAMQSHPQHVQRATDEWRRFAVYYSMMAAGHGTVAPPWLFRDPLIRYVLAEDDSRVLAVSLKRLCECLLAAGASCVFPAVAGIPPIRSPEDCDRLPAVLRLRDANLMTIHLYGSCPMGERRAVSAVDNYGRVHDVPDLMISDASILSGSLGVNPQGSIMAFCRRNTLEFLQNERGRS